MSGVAEAIDAEADDLRMIAQAMCRAEVESGAAPCTCGQDLTKCAAFDVYGHQARAVRCALVAHGRLTGEPVRLTPELVEGFFDHAARQRSSAAVSPGDVEAGPAGSTEPRPGGTDGGAA